ncbi:hypothetical protein AQD72_08705 [Klebsiella pneumoniae]|uniref:hypothetical protein n=1 Tax=Klebsiella pneumoniae TaxID=573 RepID=UPI00069F136A|nr:hypothetical protein [Klebsiella pneumoniae]ALQ82702.1 hypothetical protein AQD68_01535 [Klebsiella pneumoniae]ALQ88197.1 hypothetical protein AQD73_01490 [Klebsiella pneumoniae]MCE0135094.1 hypothetical protein [Klebsiella pneumoniae]MDK6239307.1 hypothetical protein [Klebsiella pneumoniae]OJE53872.1 hypothetical protein AQD69_12270 [Klebsiella pneumoniae]
MTKTAITRERLQEIAEDGFLKHGESKALAGMVLAAMGGDPVEWINGCNKSVPAALRYLAENPRPIGGESSFNTAHLYQLAREVELMAEAPLYRHAQPAPEHPEVLPCSVLLEPGLRFGKGIKTSTMLAALARRAVHESDMAALSPEERAEFQAGIEGFKSLIAQQPAVPDEKPTPNSLSMYAVDAVAAIAEVRGWNACRAAMLQGLKKSAGTEAVCRSSDNAQVLTSINPAPTLVSLPKNAKSLTGNSPVIGIDLASGPDRTVEVHYVVPPGYVVVPKEPTDEMIAAAMNCEDVLFNSDDSFCVQFVNIYEAMLAAAPKEVK